MEIEGLAEMIAIAQKKGDDLVAFEKRNKKRRGKGRPPLPDEQERKDAQVLRKKYRTADSTTVDGASAMKLYEMRKREMQSALDDDDDDDNDEQIIAHHTAKASVEVASKPPSPLANTNENLAVKEEMARKEAEAARRIQDMKNGRIDHTGNWSAGQKIEGGDDTKLPSVSPINNTPSSGDMKPNKAKKAKSSKAAVDLEEFRKDLYERLRISFEGIERTLSDLQGRVSEIVTASANIEPMDNGNSKGEFEELLSRKTPVIFDVSGTKMAFDAITVFHAPPCITVVSKSGSATIMPKPGANLRLTYTMDNKTYKNDPVTFLGTRFELPMFGLSFVGFIRDEEANALDVAAGVAEE